MNTTKEQAKEYLKALYNATGQTEVDETLYDRVLKYIENTGTDKESKEYKDMERQWYMADQLCKIYKNRVRRAASILSGNYDK